MKRPGDVEHLETIMPLASSKNSPVVGPKFFKVRLLTWNMHDSLPKGDLEELFGKVPLYNSSTAKPGIFPYLANDSNHPYHLVVVAGQECPTPSGIPMGLTAGFKILDKDRDKSKEFDKDHEKPSSHSQKSKDKDRDTDKEEEELENPPSGWTSMVEDYLCHNGASSSRTGSPTTADVGFPKPLMRQRSTKETRKGPYQLLIKDRLMGIYMAIYIHRDIKPLVRGMSKDAVTAGLIGGRVGNKGGVGISLNIDGTTLLFLNAHLAAHEGKINHRLANFSKIKAELTVDDFLPAEDLRKAAEDLTDRFDFTFLLGDLNFRLDISRLHADWLISRQEYAQAFEFDQLHALMKQGKYFSGFQEATINFPPTFKYDVLRTLRGAKRSKKSSSKVIRRDDRSGHLPEVDEREAEETEDGDEDHDMDRASLASSNMTSIVSRPTTEPRMEDDAYFYTAQSTPGLNPITTNISASSTHKAKVKLLSLLSPAFVTSPNKLLKAKNAEPWDHPPTPVTAIPTPLAAVASNMSCETRKRPFLRPPPMILVNSTSGPQSNLQEDNVLEERGVYDSSHKKRVPSWCDRILWKTTTFPDPIDEEIDDHDIPQRPRNRVGNFFSKPFRPSSSRTVVGTSAAQATRISSGGQVSPSLSAQRTRFASPSLADYRSPTDYPLKHRDPRPRRANTTFSPPPTAPLPSDHPHRSSTAFGSPLSADRPQSTTGSIWRFLPAFLSPTHNQGAVASDLSQSLPPPWPLKGDVICLNYNTLDDRGMRHLEGRSDHRPVIGTYAVYV